MKSYTAEILEVNNGTGDGILQLPPEFCIQDDWREGDNIHMEVKGESLIMKNLSKEEREKTSTEQPAIGTRGSLIRSIDDILFRVYNYDHTFTDYDIKHYDCEVVIIDPSAALISSKYGDFLDYTSTSMLAVDLNKNISEDNNENIYKQIPLPLD